MTTDELATTLEDWVLEKCPTIQGSYDFPTAEKTQPLPDVAVEIDNAAVSMAAEGALAEYLAVQQAMARTWTVRLFLMVPPEPGDVATAQLTGFIDTLQLAIVEDSTLGGRVPWASKESRGSFNPPFVQFEDGTRGRAATLELTVGEPIPYEE
jgi:hypothetical protein